MRELRVVPQVGFQAKVAGCSADVAVVGGSAGGGKTYSLLMEGLRWVNDGRFNALYLRRFLTSTKVSGGLMDESVKLFSVAGGVLNRTIGRWVFPSGAVIDFGGIEDEVSLQKYQGSQMSLVIFDELTEFSERMFWFMLGRNRGMSGVLPYVRASCNPLPGSWVANLLEWWIDWDSGYPIRERDGVLRYFMSYGERVYWGDSKDSVLRDVPSEVFSSSVYLNSGVSPGDMVKSFTFIRGGIEENRELLRNNPGYLGSLQASGESDRRRFLYGNWKESVDVGNLFDIRGVSGMFVVSLPESKNGTSYITCDAAKFGNDLCVIYVWDWYTVVHISIFYLSSALDIVREVEGLRVRYGERV